MSDGVCCILYKFEKNQILKKYLILYRPFLLFLAIFITTYVVLTFLYQTYLEGFKANEVDTITKIVGQNTEQLSRLLGLDVSVQYIQAESYVRVYYKKQYMARIVEGCNAISVIILFVSFVVSFLGKLKPMLLFVFFGSLVVYFLNIVRIATFCVLMYYFPEYQHFLHDVVFPLFIYGVVFFLWVLWVIKFSSYVSKAV